MQNFRLLRGLRKAEKGQAWVLSAMLRKRDRGQALVLTTLAMICLMGFLGFATDVGMLLRYKVNLQKVADAAAIAGAAQLPSGGDYTAAAQASATQNGVTNGTNGTVTVSRGTTYHPDAIKVYVSQPESTYLMSLFGYRTVTVAATAVAGLTSGNGCMYAMNTNPFKDQGITVNGTGDIGAPNCGIYDNSGLNMNGSGSITAKFVALSGPYSPGNVTPAPLTNSVPVPDPLEYWSAPPAYATCANDPQASKAGIVVQPGCYKGLTVTGPATLAAGLYVIQKNSLNLTNVTATGVTFYIDGDNKGTFGSLNGSNLTAPTTGTSGTCTQSAGCNGFLIWDTETKSPDKPQQGLDFGPGNATLTGILYFPNASLKFHGNGTTTLNASIVASAYVFDGTVNLNNYILGDGQSLIFLTPTIVE